MSVRDALLAYLRQSGLSTPRAEANLDAFAHELAEGIRLDRDITIPVHTAWSRGMTRAADLIDPMKGGDRG